MYVIDLLPIGTLLLILYIVFDFFRNRTKSLLKRLVFYSFIFYLIIVLQVTTGGINIPPREEFQIVTLQLLPFKFLFDWLQIYQTRGFDWIYWNSVKLSMYNVIMLLPLGIYLPVLFNVKIFKKVALYIMLFSLTIEIYQSIFSYFGLIILRTSNIDDLILNTLGGVIGFFIYNIALGSWVHRFIKN